MMSLRRRVMGEKKGYIRDGLILWLDAIYNQKYGTHNSDYPYLNDLTGNHQFTWHGSLTIEDKSANFDGNVFAEFSSNLIKDACNNNNITVEIIITPIAKGLGNNSGYLCAGTLVRGFWLWDSRTAAFSSFSYRTNSFTPLDFNPYGETAQIIFRKGKIFLKNSLRDYTRTGDGEGNVSNNNSLLGALTGSSDISHFRLHCLRIYNRELTDDEVLYNSMIDKDRYNLSFL